MCVLTDRWSFESTAVDRLLLLCSPVHTHAPVCTPPELHSVGIFSFSHFILFVFLSTGMTFPPDCCEFWSRPELLRQWSSGMKVKGTGCRSQQCKVLHKKWVLFSCEVLCSDWLLGWAQECRWTKRKGEGRLSVMWGSGWATPTQQSCRGRNCYFTSASQLSIKKDRWAGLDLCLFSASC